ncbi:MAG: ABC transporter ATP-binding protein [Anaerolineae bacterium]|nr:ABC transporter ATP-binding protein [Anaerolineae bacterium]
MSQLAIKVEDLGKRYRIGVREKKADNRAQAFLQTVRSPFNYLLSTLRGPSEDEVIWALRNIYFELHHGEVIGIIGHNGAGKSTLLKILSRITEPTEGYADIYGRVGSLLEVGTGFHPDLTGRENVYMNGTILGMTKIEIDRKFDEIVDFAGVEKFIDTPVKYYSSGMNVRLGFAIAAHLEPEILLVDEVLAVGDIEFQEKCLNKMDQVSQTGRTVLFVSHNIGMIENLCGRSILLSHGHMIADDDTKNVTKLYLEQLSLSNSHKESNNIYDLKRRHKHYGEIVRFSHCQIQNADSEPTSHIRLGEPFTVVVQGISKTDVKNVDVVIRLRSSYGVNVVAASSGEANMLVHFVKGKTVSITTQFDGLILSEGKYYIELYAMKLNRGLDLITNAGAFMVTESRYSGAEKFRPLYGLEGVIRYSPKWQTSVLENSRESL